MALTENKDAQVITNDLDTPQTDPTYTRRKFLQWGIYSVGAAVTLAVGVPIAWYFISPALQSKDSNKILVELGAPADFAKQTKPKAVPADYKYVDSFKGVEGSKTVFVRALKDGAAEPQDFQVLDSTCTHAGCSVAYKADANQFQCPCHGSVFAVDGTNLKVAPRPLHSYKVEKTPDGKLAINVAEYTG